MELTQRLRTVADLVPQGMRLADIGTDHAYLPVWLILKGRIPSAIAADLRSGPLSRARETAHQYGVCNQVSFRLCDGLSGISPEETDVISIAGMGGETIASILEAAPWAREKLLLLQPMTSFVELRQYLQTHHYEIIEERIAQEGRRLYSILVVRQGEMAPLTPGELLAGQQSCDPLRRAYLEMLVEKVTHSLDGHRRAALPDGAEISRLEALLRELQEMTEVYPT